jgi:uncharacterized membrane protein YhhN
LTGAAHKGNPITVDDVTDPLTVFVVAVGASLFSVETGGRRLLAVAKPLATLSLAAVAWRGGGDLLQMLVLAGIGLSVVGDVVLLFEGTGAWLLGLLLFLGAHLAYTAAFLLRGTGALWTPAVGVVVFGGASGWLVKRLWAGVGALRGPVVLYAATITAMAAAAFATLAGPWPPAAAAAAAMGALFFYLSDATLAWNRFVEPFPRGQSVTLVLYWVGQLGIALAARWATG